jgi:exopolysaccharide/PEP-CTERM locus tyrosine autokinase
MSLIEKAVERLDELHPTARTDASMRHESLLQSNTLGRDQFVSDPVEPSGATTANHVTLDLAALHASGIVTPDQPKTLIAEEFRILKRPLLTNVTNPAAPIRNANLIMVTSSLPGEGKSFTSISLAIGIAMELDRTVLLVDADVARPSLPRVLGFSEQRGLLDVLQDRSLRLSDVLLKTNIPKLSILSAGTKDAQSTELLASENMGRLLNEMSRRYPDRIIIFDSPPLLLTTESRVLATNMGQIVFVVRAEETPQSAVKEALSTIEACPVKLLVLNQARNVERAAYGYGYGYDY